MGAGNQARPLAWLQYQMASDQSISGAAGGVLTLNMATDISSSPSGLFDKPDASQFRALLACDVRISYGAVLNSNTNNEGYTARVIINGSTVVPNSQAGSNARSTTAEGDTVSRSVIVTLSANDYIQLQIVKAEGNQLTVRANGTYMLVELIRLR